MGFQKEEAMTASDVLRSISVRNKRIAINLSLSERAYKSLRLLAVSTARPVAEVLRIGIALYRVAAQARKEHNKLVVVSRHGKPLKEIVLTTSQKGSFLPLAEEYSCVPPA